MAQETSGGTRPAATKTFRAILHMDMDAFFASVEQRDHPEWQGKPVIVGAAPDRRGVVCAASYEARKFGVHSAMPSRTAGRLCPHGIYVRPDFTRYSAASEQIMALLHDVTPLVEQLSIDEAFLDVSPAARDIDAAIALARDLKARIRERLRLTASIGVAPNKFLAKLASDFQKPDGLTIIREEDKVAVLRPLPVGRIWGVGPKTEAVLHEAGILTIANLQDFTGDLRHLMGGYAEDLRALAFGEDDRPLETEYERKSISSEETFDRDTRSVPLIRRTMLDQAAEVAAELRKRHVAGRTVHIKLRFADFTTLTRQKTLGHATQDEGEIFRVAWALAERERGTGKAVRLIGTGVASLEPEGLQPDLFDEAARRRAQLAKAADAINARFGPGSVRRG
ncbi:MAG TPA: DNA polymerase IV [Verrucomicrobiae bacterium]|nr:DNA polymerase IV [Verrucomicrobiae bacterium]